MIELQHIFVINSAQPKVHLGVVLLDLYPDTVQLSEDVLFSRYEAQEDVLPDPVGLCPFEAQDEGSSVLIAFVFPDGLDLFLKEVDVGADCHVGGPFEMLVEGPELLDCCDIGYGVQTVLEAVLPLHEPLEPEAEGPMQLLFGLLFLHNISNNNLWRKMDI